MSDIWDVRLYQSMQRFDIHNVKKTISKGAKINKPWENFRDKYPLLHFLKFKANSKKQYLEKIQVEKELLKNGAFFETDNDDFKNAFKFMLLENFYLSSNKNFYNITDNILIDRVNNWLGSYCNNIKSKNAKIALAIKETQHILKKNGTQNNLLFNKILESFYSKVFYDLSKQFKEKQLITNYHLKLNKRMMVS